MRHRDPASHPNGAGHRDPASHPNGAGHRDPASHPDGAGALPLVVCGPDGGPVAVLEENEKGFRKSLEQGGLWALHPGTGRLLPFYEGARVTVTERDGWYQAVLDRVPDGGNASGDAGERVPGTAAVPADGVGRGERTGDAVQTDRVEEGGGGASLGDVLLDLADLIAKRHRELPEGSYTTHLFASGAEKIRKKAGEEAVELLLAATRETIISESADLLYHLLVLLESESISLDEIADELRKR